MDLSQSWNSGWTFSQWWTPYKRGLFLFCRISFVQMSKVLKLILDTTIHWQLFQHYSFMQIINISFTHCNGLPIPRIVISIEKKPPTAIINSMLKFIYELAVGNCHVNKFTPWLACQYIFQTRTKVVHKNVNQFYN